MPTRNSPFASLVTQLERWQQTLEELRLTVAEDRPAADDVALADQLEDAVNDALAACHSAREGAIQATAAEMGSDLNTAKRRLAQAYEEIARLYLLCATTLAGWERMRDLAELGRRRGRRWGQWSRACIVTLQDWPVQMAATSGQLLGCWEQLMDRPASATPPLSVRPPPDLLILRN